MADLVDTSDWQKRYGVIENAYCQGRWAAVMENGTVLLRELLEAGGDPDVDALRHRMQLLMAHTLLHGYGDRDAAEDLYDVVRSSDAEPSLRQMAEDGLDLCHQPLPSTLTIDEDEEDSNEEPSPPALFLPETERVAVEDDEDGDGEDLDQPSWGRSPASQMPLQPLLRTRTRSEAGPEPGDPQDPIQAQDGLPPGDLGVAADPFGSSGESGAPRSNQGLPVMPWLTESEGGVPSVNPGGQNPGEARPLEGELPWMEQTISETLRAEVVEEPELIELHQATPSLAEEVELPIKEEIAAPPPAPLDGEPEEDGDLRTGLLLVVVG
jgi:hypothetical protein